MRRLLAVYLIAAGLALVQLGRKIAGNDRPGGAGHQQRQTAAPARLVELPPANYRYIRPEPGRMEVWAAWLSILFGSLKFGLVGV